MQANRKARRRIVNIYKKACRHLFHVYFIMENLKKANYKIENLI